MTRDERIAVLDEAIAICRRVQTHWATFHSVAPTAAAQCATAIERLRDAPTPEPVQTERNARHNEAIASVSRDVYGQNQTPTNEATLLEGAQGKPEPAGVPNSGRTPLSGTTSVSASGSAPPPSRDPWTAENVRDMAEGIRNELDDCVQRNLSTFAELKERREEVGRLTDELARWQICENCGEPLDGPGICSNAISEREKGLEQMHEEALTRAEMAEAELARVRTWAETTKDVTGCDAQQGRE